MSSTISKQTTTCLNLLPQVASCSQEASLLVRFRSKRDCLDRFLEQLQPLLTRYLDLNLTLKISTGLREILMNSHEHGNLEILNKEILLAEDRYEDELRKLEETSNKQISFSIQISTESLEFKITDQGKGFSVNESTHEHTTEQLSGRGITLATSLFDSLNYEDNGTSCRLRIGRLK